MASISFFSFKHYWLSTEEPKDFTFDLPPCTPPCLHTCPVPCPYLIAWPVFTSRSPPWFFLSHWLVLPAPWLSRSEVWAPSLTPSTLSECPPILSLYSLSSHSQNSVNSVSYITEIHLLLSVSTVEALASSPLGLPWSSAVCQTVCSCASLWALSPYSQSELSKTQIRLCDSHAKNSWVDLGVSREQFKFLIVVS